MAGTRSKDETMQISIHSNRQLGNVAEGVHVEDDSLVFNFESDSSTDIVRLTETVKQLQLYGRTFYYAYEFSPDTDSNTRTRFIHDLKFGGFPKDAYSRFIIHAVDSLDKTENLDSFSIVVYPESKSSVVSDVLEYIYMCAHKPMKSFKVVKSLPKDIEFDYDAFEQTRLESGNYTEAQKQEVIGNIRKMMDSIHSLDYFSIARNSKYKYRKYIKDFYHFESEEQSKAFGQITDERVLLIDDVTTSGTTLSLILQTLKCSLPKEIVVFSLIGNNKL